MMPHDFSAMSDAQLAEAAAGCMGWAKIEKGGFSPGRTYTNWLKPDGVIVKDWRPQKDLNHAAEFGAAFLAKWPSVDFQINRYPGTDVFVVFLLVRRGPAWRYTHANEARARTVAILAEWAALESQSGE